VTAPLGTPAFDAVAGRYREAVEGSIGFIGKGLDFFTRAKVDHLLALGDRHLGNLRHRSVLDVGCGNGGTDSYLSPWVGELHGVDVSPQMVDESRRRNTSGLYQTYDGSTLPFPDRSFDVTFAACVMHHVPPVAWDSFAAELVRVTRLDGLAMVFEHNPLNPLTRRAVSNCEFDDDAVLLRPKRVSTALRRGGAVVVARRYILFTPLESQRVRGAEQYVSWLPLGAQYVVAARPGGEPKVSGR
jgi:SAM-dependent methyltransferase